MITRKRFWCRRCQAIVRTEKIYGGDYHFDEYECIHCGSRKTIKLSRRDKYLLITIGYFIREGMLTEELYDSRPVKDEPKNAPFLERTRIPRLDLPERFDLEHLILPFSKLKIGGIPVPFFKKWFEPKPSYTWGEDFSGYDESFNPYNAVTAATIIVTMDKFNDLLDSVKAMFEFVKMMANEID
jgi:DNA-directed RNA polymerase subunit RPC12/RpoP